MKKRIFYEDIIEKIIKVEFLDIPNQKLIEQYNKLYPYEQIFWDGTWFNYKEKNNENIK